LIDGVNPRPSFHEIYYDSLFFGSSVIRSNVKFAILVMIDFVLWNFDRFTRLYSILNNTMAIPKSRRDDRTIGRGFSPCWAFELGRVPQGRQKTATVHFNMP
jgi:hypothetical protein